MTAGIAFTSTGPSGSAVRPDRRSDSAFIGGKVDFARFRISAPRTFLYVYRRSRTRGDQARRPRRRGFDNGRQPANSPGTDRRVRSAGGRRSPGPPRPRCPAKSYRYRRVKSTVPRGHGRGLVKPRTKNASIRLPVHFRPPGTGSYRRPNPNVPASETAVPRPDRSKRSEL